MHALKKIVIVGGGSAGWMAAAILSSQLKTNTCAIELIEADRFAAIGVGESTVPSFIQLLQHLGIDEQEFISETAATYKLGIRFVDWQQRQQSYFHPFGVIGSRIDNYDFYQCWLKARQQGNPIPLEAFSPCAVMAHNDRFFLPNKARHTPIGGANYALHVDAKLANKVFRRYAEAHGVVRTEGAVKQVVRGDNGFISRLMLEDGSAVQGDFFIDCTGFKALLIDKALAAPFEDWSHFLPCDRALAVKTERQGPTQPYTLATARKFGWTWRIPLRQLTGHGYVYGSQFCSDAQAKAELNKVLDGAAVEDFHLLPFNTGLRRQSWKFNCLALGLAAGFIEPLESTTLHLIARGLDLFLRYFPDSECDVALSREYNRRMQADYEEVRDFIVLHYCATQRQDTAFWRWCRKAPLPDSLSARIELFRGHGALRDGTDELFRHTSWQSVFEGMGIHPQKYSPRVDNLDEGKLKSSLRDARLAIRGMVNTLPSHDDFLRRSRITATTTAITSETH